jgi:hypothetical protein
MLAEMARLVAASSRIEDDANAHGRMILARTILVEQIHRLCLPRREIFPKLSA